VKVVLSPEEADLTRAWADARMARDSHGDRTGTYRVDTLYLDTKRLDAYHRTADTEGMKFRVRRYDTEDQVWLERKRRRGELVRKRRDSWALARLPEVLRVERELDAWPGVFQQEVARQSFEPRLLISYLRTAWNGCGRMRLTLDSGVEARLPGAENLFDAAGPRVSVGNVVVLEIKYEEHRPALFEELLREIGRDSASFSKYGHGVEAAGLAIARRSPDAASTTTDRLHEGP
jgi:hypothetical protein